MLENFGKVTGEIITFIISFVFKIFGKLLALVGAGMVQAFPWYVKVIIVIIIISILLPVLKIIFQAIRFVIGKIFGKK